MDGRTDKQKLVEADAEARAMRRSPEYIVEQNRDLADACRSWRKSAGMTAQRAADVLGLPKRTYDGIEQGRGFRYPQLLILAIQAFYSTPDRDT